MGRPILTAAQHTLPARRRKPKPKKSHLLVMLASLAAGAGATVTALDSWNKVLVEFGIKKSDDFILAQNNAQGQLLRDVTRLISQRVFWTERYAGSVSSKFPTADQDEAWKRYNDAVIAWNESYMLNIRLIEKNFGAASKDKLANLHWVLRQMNTCLNRIRYRAIYAEKDQACHFAGVTGGSEADNVHAVNTEMTKIDGMVDDFTTLVAK